MKLDEESGAAGLAFCSDGGEKHYGFYPTNGSLRLTRFEGPDVFTWKVLEELRSEHYRPGEWNVLHARVEPERITCFLNGQKVIESTDTVLRGGRAGLCKFRQTAPAFRGFRLSPPAPESERESFLRTARQLEEESRRLRELADRSHHAAVEKEVRAVLDKEDGEIDLIEAALHVARLDDPELEVAAYRERIRRLRRNFAAPLDRSPAN